MDENLSEIRSKNAEAQGHAANGRFRPKGKPEEKPLPFLQTNTPTKDPLPKLFTISATNPFTYFILWWRKVIGNEGMDFHLKVKPLTAIAIVAVIASGTFSLGLLVNVVRQAPVVKYIPAFAASPTPDPFRDTAYSGILRVAGDKYYLVTTDAEAITLSAPANINLSKYVGRRIFATGRYNKETGILVVTEASDLELLPTQISPVPTI